MSRHDLTDAQWAVLVPLLLPPPRTCGERSGPVQSAAMDPAGVELGAARLDAMGGDRDGLGHRWWMLRSHSLQILPTGAWRVMATLTTRGSSRLVELHPEVDPKTSGRDRLGVVDRGGRGGLIDGMGAFD